MPTASKLEIVRYAWERTEDDTDRAYQAFEVYRLMGASRSLAKVAEKLGKSTTIIERWSKRDNWYARVHAWDRHEGRIINQRILAGTASMRERQINAALSIMNRAQARVLQMTQDEINALKPLELAALLRVATEIERKARELDEAEVEGIQELQAQFIKQYIYAPQNFVAVNVDGEYGWIPEDRVEDFRKDCPHAVIVI